MIINFIMAFFMVVIAFNIWNKLSNTKLSFKSIRTWLFILIASFSTLINYFFTDFFKFMNITIIFIAIYKFAYKTSLKESIIPPLISQVIFLISETIFVYLFFYLFKDGTKEFVSNYAGAFISNFIVSLLAFFISRFRFVKKFSILLKRLVFKISEISLLFFSISILYVYSIFAFNIYYGSDPKFMILLSASITLLAFILIYMFLKSQDEYYNIMDRFNSSLLSLKELEKSITEHRIDNHENRNHLLTIRNMTTSKKIIKFIDSILNNNINDSKRVMKEASSIPSGGLRGLVYSKLLIMTNKNIEYELDIARSVRNVDMLEFEDDLILNICKIVGIFLDNAIEEVETIDDKYIIIEMYKEKEVITISVTNTYNSKIDIKDIYKPGYSTKGYKHGYGLSLVKKIVNKNNNLHTHCEINEEEFTQVLEVYK